jgi:glyoxylase-like metal-dependent hydrolase (beta-lactamase superfamily II)
MAVSSNRASPTGATYVEPSAETILQPGTKIGDLYRRNMSQPYVLQRLSERVWWIQTFNYGTVVCVGDKGVLIFDTLEGVYDNITQAVASVTDKPIVASVYPHYHADHMGDIDKYVDAARRQGIDFQIYASSKSRESMDRANSSFPRPTQELKWPRDSFDFDGLTVELHGFEWAAHSDDHAAWLLKQDRILHAPDLINPDQPPFWRFAGNERFRFHEDNLKEIYNLEWDYLSGSHGNIGTRADIDFHLEFVADLKASIGKAMEEHPFSEFVDPSADAHTAFLANFFAKISSEATDALRPKYGQLYGFEYATPPNAEMAAWTMFEYR